MAARNKSKKTTKSKTKRMGPASSAKAASKRAPKEPSASSARNRVGKSKPAFGRAGRAQGNSREDKKWCAETFETKTE